MAPTTIAADTPAAVAVAEEAPGPAVNWGAIWAGAATATAISLILFFLGSGIGLASISPWPQAGASATAFGVGAAIWLIVIQWLSSGIGGYIAGRLRTKWVNVKTDEVFFRDTAHGFIAWAVATLFIASLVVVSASGVLRTATDATATVAAGVAQGAGEAVGGAADPMAYFTDRLFRSPTAPVENAEVRTETALILARGATADAFPGDDRDYLVQLVATQTGVPAEEAAARVDAAIADAQAAEAEVRAAADDARQAAAGVAFYAFLSMLIGAFIACVAAVIGGRQRDDQRVIVR